MTFHYPWLLLAPAVYALVRLMKRPSQANAIPYFSSSILSSIPQSLRLRLKRPLLFVVEASLVISLSIAAARPQRTKILTNENFARNIMLVVDTSNSMSGKDFPTTLGTTTRMEGVKSVVAEYVRSRTQDRIGLVVFGNNAYLQSPLTTDTSLVEGLVMDLQPRIAGDGTAIGDGLGLALKRLRNVDGDSKAIILMTDGVNTAGQVKPLKAAAIAKSLNIKVHTIGIGSKKAPLGARNVIDILRNQRGAVADIDEKSLREIASITGGIYFNANSLDEFKRVYERIQLLQEEEFDEPGKLLVEELFTTWAWISLFCSGLLLVLEFVIFREIP